MVSLALSEPITCLNCAGPDRPISRLMSQYASKNGHPINCWEIDGKFELVCWLVIQWNCVDLGVAFGEQNQLASSVCELSICQLQVHQLILECSMKAKCPTWFASLHYLTLTAVQNEAYLQDLCCRNRNACTTLRSLQIKLAHKFLLQLFQGSYASGKPGIVRENGIS